MKPSIGRIVIFTTTTGEKRAALVVKVWSETCVNLQAFEPDQAGMLFVSSVTQGNGNCQWNWPVIEK